MGRHLHEPSRLLFIQELKFRQRHLLRLVGFGLGLKPPLALLLQTLIYAHGFRGKAGNRLRITGQLIDAGTGHHIWANKFDGNLEDVFDLQDTITDAIVAAIEPSVKEAELQRSRSKSTESLQAYDLCLQALPNINWMISKREDNDKALFLLFKAIALDPSYTLGKALAAFATVLRKSQHWSTPDEEAAGIRLAEEALSSHGDHPTALACAAHALAYLGRRYDPALRAMDQALDLGRNSWRVLTSNAWVRVYCGDGEAALKSFERCMRLIRSTQRSGSASPGWPLHISSLGATRRHSNTATPRWMRHQHG